MQRPSETARISATKAVLFLVCLSVTAGSPAARADYDAGMQALEAGQPSEAAAQWRAAAQEGDRRAMLGLGRLFARGLGVVQDYVEAHKWFNLASSKGEAAAAKERDALAAKMTPIQVAKAQERAKTWQDRRAARTGTATADPRPDSGTSTSSTSRPRAPAPAEIEALLNLQPADRRLIQSGLAALGFRPGPADGVFGPATRAALKSWQQKNGRRETGWLTKASASVLKAAGEKELARAKASRAKAARAALKPGRVFRDCKDCPEMVVVPAGSFTMGSPPDEEDRDDDEGPQHRVTISKPFAVGKYEVTRGEFAKFVAETYHSTGNSCVTDEFGGRDERSDRGWQNPGFVQADRHPVACVNWHDAQAYVRWLSKKTGKRYRLLTEAEWEYTARAGTRTRFHWGDSESENQARCGGCGNSIWAITSTKPVGSYAANQFGLHDVHGNLYEWVEDCSHRDYRGAPSDGSAWTTGGDCKVRVLRGGSWANYSPESLRAADRYASLAGGVRRANGGFRVVRTLGP